MSAGAEYPNRLRVALSSLLPGDVLTYLSGVWTNSQPSATTLDATLLAGKLLASVGGIWTGANPGAVSEAVSTVVASGAAQTIPALSAATITRITLTANCVLTFPTAAAGARFTLVLIQDATGSRTVTWPAVKWAGAAAPTLSTGANKIDVLSFLCADGANWLGFTNGLDVR